MLTLPTRNRLSGQDARRSSGFTLIELLAVITVIAILAGLLVPAVMNVFYTVEQATITTEMQQLDLAVEQFKNDYHIYPPSVGVAPGVIAPPVQNTFAISDLASLRRYLAKIAPNHNENSQFFGAAAGDPSRIELWWANVGSRMDDRSTLVFWLNGLCKNKQYPLTGHAQATMSPVAYNANLYRDGSAPAAGITFEREVFIEFNRVEPSGGGLAFALQPAGDESNDIAYRYRDHRSYEGIGSSVPASDFFVDDAYHTGVVGGVKQFIRPNKFQITGFGMDGLPGTPMSPPTADFSNVYEQVVGSDDNICNFAEGRLDKFINDTRNF